MYNFIDVTEVSESVVLPSEAVQINGVYIEDQISGYRTLHVSGREALSPEITTYETGVRDGSVLKSKRFPARTIIITYRLVAETNESFREAYNQLGSILNVEDAELIFNDEPDKFFIGTPSFIGEVEPGANSVVGEIEILCTDPFKYSVVEHEGYTDMASGAILVNYGGTYKSYPTLEADFFKEEEVAADGVTAGSLTGAGDCGYVAFFNEKEKIIQLGDPEEEDTELLVGVASQTLINQSFTSTTAWGSAAKRLWALNSASGMPAEFGQVGTLGIGTASPAVYTDVPDTQGTLLTATSKADKPTFKYTVTAKAYDRTQTTVKLDIAVTVALGNEDSYFGYSLAVGLYINKTWHEIVFRKNSDATWKGNSGHTKGLTVTVTGLKAETNSISGIKFKAYRNDSYGTAGTLKETSCKALKISKWAANVNEKHYLTATNYGTGSTWHAATMQRNIDADLLGEVGATDFTLTINQRLSIGSGKKDTKQYGAFSALLIDDTSNVVAGFRIYKNSTKKTANIDYYVGGKVYKGKNFDLSYSNYYNKKTCVPIDQASTITKSGNKVTFAMFTGVKTVYTDDAITDSKAKKVVFAFEAFSDKPILTYNGLNWVKFVKNNCNTLKDIPNKFTANDVVVADCSSGEILLNGVSAPELGALGNDWEEFYLEPGLNQIGFAYSDWVADEYAPTIKLRYREVFL